MEEHHLNGFVEKASAGVLALYEEDYKKQCSRIGEFLSKQNELLSEVDQELAKLGAFQNFQLDNMMSTLKTCQTRLNAIKDRMVKASNKAAKLKERSLKLQQIKQKEALERELRREAQLTREQEMVAKSPSIHAQKADNVSKTEPTKFPETKIPR